MALNSLYFTRHSFTSNMTFQSITDQAKLHSAGLINASALVANTALWITACLPDFFNRGLIGLMNWKKINLRACTDPLFTFSYSSNPCDNLSKHWQLQTLEVSCWGVTVRVLTTSGNSTHVFTKSSLTSNKCPNIPARRRMTWSSSGSSEKWGILLAHSTKVKSCLSAAWQMFVTGSLGCRETCKQTPFKNSENHGKRSKG